MLREQGAATCVQTLMQRNNLTFAEAWEELKRMVNS